MADDEHLAVLTQGVETWNAWREANPWSEWPDLSEAHLHGLELSNINFAQVGLSGADLEGANLRGARLSRANLRGTGLARANLQGADLSGADLRGSDLTQASLAMADLSHACLVGAKLRGADLTQANLRGADVRGADLLRAVLIRARLHGATLDADTLISDGWRLAWEIANGERPKQEQGIVPEVEIDRDKTLDELEGVDSGEDTFRSSVTLNWHRLRHVPLREFALDDLRFMIGQGDLDYIVPLAIEQLEGDPFVADDYLCDPGVLLRYVLTIDRSFWSRRPHLLRRALAVAGKADAVLEALRDTKALWEALRDVIRDDELSQTVKERIAKLSQLLPKIE